MKPGIKILHADGNKAKTNNTSTTQPYVLHDNSVWHPPSVIFILVCLFNVDGKRVADPSGRTAKA